MVQIPGAEDDAALLAAVGIDGVEGRARVPIERALEGGGGGSGDRCNSKCSF